ncbi:MAG: tRNA dihydrouridine(20/20a) synthase DusA [Gammaproteobacteria bacterium]|nr:tRNA dihydrouridine(20/20a) synthase DusA [Gammaproteobacteria bacterium]
MRLILCDSRLGPEPSRRQPATDLRVPNIPVPPPNKHPRGARLSGLSHRFCVAPMMDGTDRHCRYFHRLLSRHARLYSEMITTGAILHGDRERHLRFDPAEHPVALQLGGSDPKAMAECAAIAEAYGYDEVNINVGCPSDRVQSGRFGACLMREPRTVADCVAAMRARVRIPVTVKSRIGVDNDDSVEALFQFIELNREAGCEVFIIHARKAWLSGLSPKQNREIPPLRYEVVHQVKARHPDLTIVINGGLQNLPAARAQLEQVDGVMLGREVYRNPYLLAEVDDSLFNACTPAPTRREVVESMLDYCNRELARGTYLSAITRHMIGLFQGRPRARAWRRHLSEHAHRRGADAAVLEAALEQVLIRTAADPADVVAEPRRA